MLRLSLQTTGSAGASFGGFAYPASEGDGVGEGAGEQRAIPRAVFLEGQLAVSSTIRTLTKHQRSSVGSGPAAFSFNRQILNNKIGFQGGERRECCPTSLTEPWAEQGTGEPCFSPQCWEVFEPCILHGSGDAMGIL